MSMGPMVTDYVAMILVRERAGRLLAEVEVARQRDAAKAARRGRRKGTDRRSGGSGDGGGGGAVSTTVSEPKWAQAA